MIGFIGEQLMNTVPFETSAERAFSALKLVVSKRRTCKFRPRRARSYLAAQRNAAEAAAPQPALPYFGHSALATHTCEGCKEFGREDW